jgi:hypothetical protein
MTEVDWSKPLTPELEALMRLKYEDENPTGFILIIWRKCLFRTLQCIKIKLKYSRH